ncbi:MAG: flagellar basal body-associated FliL family protein [Candidatus Nitrospinota bacterium M3_3B_026]
MADEEADAPKKGAGKLIIIIAAALILVIGGGAAAYFLVMPRLAAAPEPAAKSGEEAPAETEAGASLGATYELDPFIVNLTGDVNRYLKVVVVLQLSDKNVAEEIANRSPQIKDTVITLLSSKTAEEILSIQGKYDLKMEMAKRINALLTTGVVRKLYFVEFVIQ